MTFLRKIGWKEKRFIYVGRAYDFLFLIFSSRLLFLFIFFFFCFIVRDSANREFPEISFVLILINFLLRREITIKLRKEHA